MKKNDAEIFCHSFLAECDHTAANWERFDAELLPFFFVSLSCHAAGTDPLKVFGAHGEMKNKKMVRKWDLPNRSKLFPRPSIRAQLRVSGGIRSFRMHQISRGREVEEQRSSFGRKMRLKNLSECYRRDRFLCK